MIQGILYILTRTKCIVWSTQLHGDKSEKRTVGRIVSHNSTGFRVMVEGHTSLVLLRIATL